MYIINLIDFYFLHVNYPTNWILSFIQKLDAEFDEVSFGLEVSSKMMIGKCNHCNTMEDVTNVTTLSCNKSNQKNQPTNCLTCANIKTNTKKGIGLISNS